MQKLADIPHPVLLKVHEVGHNRNHVEEKHVKGGTRGKETKEGNVGMCPWKAGHVRTMKNAEITKSGFLFFVGS